MTVVGIVNFNDTHWIVVVVDTVSSTIWVGDSLGEANTGVWAAVAWWINAHIPHKFLQESLPMTHQQDNHSCLIFAANAAGHFILPAQIPLLWAEDGVKERISTFLHVAQCDIKLVSNDVNTCHRAHSYIFTHIGQLTRIRPLAISIHLMLFQGMEASFSHRNGSPAKANTIHEWRTLKCDMYYTCRTLPAGHFTFQCPFHPTWWCKWSAHSIRWCSQAWNPSCTSQQPDSNLHQKA